MFTSVKKITKGGRTLKLLYGYVGKAKDFKIIEIKKDQSAATEKVQEKNID